MRGVSVQNLGTPFAMRDVLTTITPTRREFGSIGPVAAGAVDQHEHLNRSA